MSELLTVAAAAPVFFFSDAHLGALRGADSQRQTDQLQQLFERVQAGARTLVIVGDLFDFWFEWKHVIPKHQFTWLARLRQLVENGVEIHYLAGNHDFRLHGFLEQTVGMRVHRDAVCFAIEQQKLFVYHGDGILKRDSGYRLLKRLLRHSLAQKIFAWIHPDIGMALARRTSLTSRHVIKERPTDDPEYLAFAQTKLAAGFDAVILGHTHRPVEFRDGAKTYINLGDWIKHFTYAVHDGNTLALIRL
jgi:UDP-2,3-diacylglucosamine hydrolase